MTPTLRRGQRMSLAWQVAAWLVAGLVAVGWTVWQTDRGFRNDLLLQSSLVATAVDFEKLKSLQGTPADLSNPEHHAIARQMRSVMEAMPDWYWVYLLYRKTDGTLATLVDSSLPDADDFAAPGNLYPDAPEPFFRAHGTGQREVFGLYSDKWGTWVSAAVPMVDPETNQSIAVFGIDVSSDVWIRKVAFHASIPIGLFALLGVVIAIRHRAAVASRIRQEELLASERRARAQRSALTRLALDAHIVSENVPRALEVVAEVLANTLELAVVRVWKMADDGSALRCDSCFTADGRRLSAEPALSAKKCPLYFEALVRHGIISASDAWSDPRTAVLAESCFLEREIASVLDAGIVVEGKLEGVVSCAHVLVKRQWRSDEESFVSTVAAIVAQLFANDIRRRAENELEKMTEALIAAKDKAESANRAKSAFLSSMSHEIRTPLNAILGMTELLDEGKLDPKQREQVEVLQSSGNHLLEVVNDILDFSKLEDHGIQLESAPFDLPATIMGCMKMIEARALKKSLQVVCEVVPDVPRFVAGDAMRLRQVIINLLGNAVKFTERGGVHLRVETVAGTRLCIEVKDTGIGIAQEKLPRLFDRFSQADSSITRQYGGTGLGLAISKEIVVLMGGELHVQSVVGVGTTFKVLIPLPLAEPNRALSKAEDKAVAPRRVVLALPPMSLLLVDDFDINRDMIKSYLEDYPVEIVEAINGHEAVKQCARRHFDVVLMDLEMPEMDGISAVKRIRASEVQAGSQSTHIIALTAHVVKEYADECIKAGMQSVLTKPIRSRKLLEELHAAILAKGTTGN